MRSMPCRCGRSSLWHCFFFFKQKTAYEISACLVGSEMCIRDRAKLLRVLEDSETRRLGDTRTVRTDVRLIASTNKDLNKLIREEKFRSDLFYRLNVVSITLPPLRERKGDIPALVDHFIRKYNAHSHKTVSDLSLIHISEPTRQAE